MPLPDLKPMLLEKALAPFDDPDSLFEPKLDGMRLLAYVDGEQVRLVSRLGVDNVDQHPWLAADLRKLNCTRAILDGELVALDQDGRPNFQLLQNRQNNGTPLYFYAFDLLWFNEQNLCPMALRQRRALLEMLLAGQAHESHIRLNLAVTERGKDLYEVILQNGFEGMVAKRLDSRYYSGKRSSEWVKVKPVKTASLVVGGYTAGSGWRSDTFGALVLGYFKPGSDTLTFVGKVGTGFNEKELARLLPMLQTRVSNTSTFASGEPLPNEPITWVRPELVAEVGYDLISDDGILRFPRYKGLRDDIDPRQACPA